jgi:hypothetical protein
MVGSLVMVNNFQLFSIAAIVEKGLIQLQISKSQIDKQCGCKAQPKICGPASPSPTSSPPNQKSN